MARDWIAAAQAARTFATTGPIVMRFAVDGVGIGGTLDAAVGRRVRIDVDVASAAPLDSLRILGVDGPRVARAWPAGERRYRTSFELEVTRDEFLVLDVMGSERPTARIFAPRAVTSPVWIRTGVPWSVPDAVRRRAKAAMETFWDLSLTARGYASAADSSRAFAHTRQPAGSLPRIATAPPPR